MLTLSRHNFTLWNLALYSSVSVLEPQKRQVNTIWHAFSPESKKVLIIYLFFTLLLAFCLWLNTAHVIRVYSANMHVSCFSVQHINCAVYLQVLVLTVWPSSFLCTECTWKHRCGHRRPVNEPGEMPSNKNLSVEPRQRPPTQRLCWGIQSSGENRKWDAGLTVSCCHQGLELLSFGWRLGPGAGSHGNLGSSGCPVERRTVNTFALCSVRMCLAPCFDSWQFMM